MDHDYCNGWFIISFSCNHDYGAAIAKTIKQWKRLDIKNDAGLFLCHQSYIPTHQLLDDF